MSIRRSETDAQRAATFSTMPGVPEKSTGFDVSSGVRRAPCAGTERAFDSCRFDGDALVLSYMYGVDEVVSPNVDTTGADIVVALRVRHGGGSAVAVGLMGEAQLAIYGGRRTARYRGGDVLSCTG